MNCKLSQGSRDMLSQLLADEKEPTRLWLRNEMDLTVEPMLLSIFQRLTNKLANTDWDREGTDGDRSRMDPLNHVETNNPQMNPSLIAQSTSLTSSFNHDSHQQHSICYEPEFDPEILAQVKREIKEEQNEMELSNVMDNTTQTNQQIEVCDQPKIKEELDDGEMMVIDEKLDDYDINNDGEIHEESENENHHENLAGADDDTEIDSDNDDEIEDNQNEGESSRFVENAQMDTTPPNLAGQSQINPKKSPRISKRKQTEEEHTNELNNQEGTENEEDDDEKVIYPQVKRPRPSHPKTSSTTKQTQFIIDTLQCPQCGQMFAKDKLNKHLKERHSIDPFRCLVKNCKQTFSNKNLQGHHIAQSHQSISQWPCDKCDKHFPSYPLLSRHNNQLHQIGHFQCSYPSCTFTGEYRRKVFDHYTYQHKQTFKCQHAGCPFETAKSSNLNQHRLVHLGIRPYRCKWPNCVFAAALQSDTIRHIRRHLAQKPSSVQNVTSVSDPRDYLEVIHNLL